jgi:hypothetical protein
MQIQPVRRLAVFCAATLLLAACSAQKEPARKLVGDVEATVIAASPEAAKYVPDQLADVQSKLASLKASLDKQDYAAVVSAGPAVLVAAEELATAAAAKKDEILKALNDEWTGLAAALPGDMTAIQNRIEQLSSKSAKKMAAGIDLEAAKASVGDVSSLWSKAQAAFASGNLAEAVSTAKDVKTKVEALAASLKMDLPPPQAAA